MEFVRLNKTLEDKGVLLSTEELNDFHENTVSKQSDTDWYSSLFTFGAEAKTHFDSNDGSISGYNGPAYTNNLVFDMDNADLNKAREDVFKLLNRLAKEIGLGKEGISKHVRVYFSGNKGFHVFIKTDRQFAPDELKDYCKAIAGDLSSFDPKIYNTTRCFRICNTRNQKSGLYKIPVSMDLIKDKDGINKIKELAKTTQDATDVTTPLQDLSGIEKFVSFRKNLKKSVVVPDDVEEVDGIRGLGTIDFKKGKGVPKCIYALSQGVMVPGKGQRHEVFLHLGNYYRNQGHSSTVVEGILNGVAKLNHNLYPEHDEFATSEIKHSIIKMVFSDEQKHNIGGWGVAADNEVFAAYCKAIDCGERCPIHNKGNKKAVVKISDVAGDFKNFAANFEDNVISTGIKFVDDNMKIAIGTSTLLVGAAGSGKTSLCLSALERANKKNIFAMFFSLDMHKNLVYMKLAQRFTNYKQDEIFKFYRNHDVKKIEEISEAVNSQYDKTLFDFSGQLSIDDIIHRVEVAEQEYSEKVKLVVVDYASRLTGPYSDRHANEGSNALKSKDAADETDAAWIILNQISRQAGDGSTPLRSKRVAKGSGDWEEAASNVITVWRPFMGIDNIADDDDPNVRYQDKYMRLYLAKNRMGPEKETVLLWDGSKGHVTEMDDAELDEYNREIKPLEKKVWKAKFSK